MHDTLDLARKVATLSGLGLERIDVAPVEREAFPAERGWWKVVHTRPAMGTLVSVTALARSTAWAEDAIGLAFAEMDRLIAIFSRYDSGSAVTVLNAAGSLDTPPPELASVVRTSLEYHGSTGGAFDVTVAPLLALFRERLAAPVPAEPTEEEIRDRLAVVDARDVESRKGRIGLRRAGMAVTLDGIAKGFIVDAMAHALGTYGVRRYLVNAGATSARAGRRKAGGRGRSRCAIRGPRSSSPPRCIWPTARSRRPAATKSVSTATCGSTTSWTRRRAVVTRRVAQRLGHGPHGDGGGRPGDERVQARAGGRRPTSSCAAPKC